MLPILGQAVPVLVLLLTTGVNAGCYTRGPFIKPLNGATNAANACFGWYSGSTFVKGAFQDVYFKSHAESPNPATICVNGPAGTYQHIVFQITNLQDNGRTLPQRDCADGLQAEVNNCEYGGQSDKWGWRFRSDAEDGWC